MEGKSICIWFLAYIYIDGIRSSRYGRIDSSSFGLVPPSFFLTTRSSTDFAAERMVALGVKIIFGFFRLSAVTSASVSIILAGTTMRNEPRSAKSTLCPNSRASRTIAPRLMRALLTSPAESEVSRTMRSPTILFVRCCCETGCAKYTVCPLRLPIGCVFYFTSNSIIALNCLWLSLM